MVHHMKNLLSYFNKKQLSMCIACLIYALPTWAYHDAVQVDVLPTIVVNAKSDANSDNQKLVTNNQDLVRYSTDMGTSELGRFGGQGFNIRGVDGNRVDMTVDGIAQADSETISVVQNYSYYNRSRINVDNEMMSRVNIQKSSSANALGGAVNYQTKNVDDILLDNRKIGAYLKNTYNGSRKEWINTVGVAVDSQYVDALALYSYRKGHETQIHSKDNGIKMGQGRSMPDPYQSKQHSYLAKLGFKWDNEQHRIELKADKQNNKNQGQELSYSTATFREFNDEQERESYGVFYQYQPTQSTWLERFKIGYDHQDTTMSATNKQNGRVPDHTNRGFYTQLNQATLDMKFKPTPSIYTKHQLSLNAGYSQLKFKSADYTYSNNRSANTYMPRPVERNRWHIALRDDIQFTPDNLTGYIALRYDHTQFEQQTRKEKPEVSVLSGGLGINYQFNPTWNLGYRFNTGFRMPTATEMYFGGKIRGLDIVSNPSLKPEYSHNHELSLKADSAFGQFNLTGYQNRYQDMIERVVIANDTYQSQNIREAKVSGLDISAQLDLHQIASQLPHGLMMNLGFGYATGKKDTGERLLSIQPKRSLFGLSYQAPDDNWSIHLQGQYVQAKKAKDTIAYRGTFFDRYTGAPTLASYGEARYLSPSYTVFDLYGHKNFGKNTSINLGIYNLFNKKYRTWDSVRSIASNPSLSNTPANDGIERYNAPKRYMMASVEFKF